MSHFKDDFEDPGSMDDFDCDENCEDCEFYIYDDCKEKLIEKINDDDYSRKLEEIEAMEEEKNRY